MPAAKKPAARKPAAKKTVKARAPTAYQKFVKSHWSAAAKSVGFVKGNPTKSAGVGAPQVMSECARLWRKSPLSK